ncbi:HAMP domain-containing histidine kinase [Nanchangia anserum]|uniref:histidine kinase n=1 Tax=Nanchangia anserum TaxID=2692125 RepID=A0A8I0G8W7_9ACTO|nr:HAMP domain-containing sensor histidine kinase [Nanchangia anserum]MBD3689309.1 HAMP domain-containing histidine kinase [Nanchangia anserum]QOX81524.1 HAMP domain-containing histidine kinase [Nanchangia anserum]
MSERRPAYAPAARTLPKRVIDHAEFSDARLKPVVGRFTLANLRVRITVNIVVISLVVLVLMGTVMAIAGIIQVHSSQDRQSRAALASVREFADSLDGTSGFEVPTTTETLVYSYLTRAPRESGTTIVGFVGGVPELYQAGSAQAVVAKSALMDRVTSLVATSSRARATTLRVASHDYRITVIPLRVVGDEPGAVVLIHDTDEALDQTINLVRLFSGVALIVLSLVGLVTSLSMSRILKPLAQLRAMMRSVATADDLTQRIPVSSSDDLGDLASSFNGMVDRLQNATEAQRHLLNDAGHELRTPLTVVQGHLELMDPTNPTDAAHTRDLVLGEISRMHRMSEDLIDVARAATPHFVRPERISLTELTLDVLQHAAQLGSQRVALDHLAEGDAIADPQRLSQAMLQLVENATKFSAPDSQIFIGSGIGYEPTLGGADSPITPTTRTLAPGTSRPDEPWASLWVRDHGIGVEAHNAPRIFERFARIDHQTPGSGLGLTIVTAIAALHGGALELTSRPGCGSMFTLYIPLTSSGNQGGHHE